jgi:hypothetical protein
MTTLAGIDDEPAEIPGWGPEGQPTGVITTRRRPTTAQRRQVEARNPTCVFPGCRMPATECDLNHEIPWAESHRTTIRELGPLCRRNHIDHHRHRWKLKQTRPGYYQWTSPLGHTYTTGPDPP